MSARRPGTPRLLRAINDRAALELLSERGPLTRAQIGELTGLSKVTAGQLIERLEGHGIVAAVGETDGGRGPNARLYAIVPEAAFVAAVSVEQHRVSAVVADVAGRERGRAERPVVSREDEPVEAIAAVVRQAARRAKVPVREIRDVVVGTPGVIDPGSGELEFSWDFPRWHHGLTADLQAALPGQVTLANDVNLVGIAEITHGAGQGARSCAVVWVGEGVGMALVLDGVVVPGHAGGAGEIGYLPVPGAPVRRMADRGSARAAYHGGLQSLVSSSAVRLLGREHGFTGRSGPAALRKAVAVRESDPEAARLLATLAARIAYGVVAISAVADPEVIVLSGDVGWAGGTPLADRVAAEVTAISPLSPRVIPGVVEDQPALRGALVNALAATREQLFTGMEREAGA